MEIYFVKLVFDKIQIRILLSKRHIFLFRFVQSLKADSIIGGGIQVSTSGVTRIGTTGLFTAIVIGWATIQIYRFTVKHNWQIKMSDLVPAGVSNSFSSLIPGFCVAFVVAMINLILVLLGTDIFKVMYVPFCFYLSSGPNGYNHCRLHSARHRLYARHPRTTTMANSNPPWRLHLNSVIERCRYRGYLCSGCLPYMVPNS